MQLKPFEASRYDHEHILVSNPANGKQELFSSREFEVVRFLKQNESQSLLALLMPNIGIAKKSHITTCLSVLAKLRRVQIVDYYGITGRMSASSTDTPELPPVEGHRKIPIANAFVELVTGVFARVFAPLTQAGLFALILVLAVVSLSLFPFDDVSSSIERGNPGYGTGLLFGYLVICLGLSFRSLVQAAWLRSMGRDLAFPSLSFFTPFIAIDVDRRAASLFGFKARAQLAVIGVLAPLALGSFFTLMAKLGLLQVGMAYIGLAACVATSLGLFCPLLSLDGAALLQSLFFRESLEDSVSVSIRSVLCSRLAPTRSLQISLAIAAVWYLVWCHGLYSFYEFSAVRIARDLHDLFSPGAVGPAIWVVLLLAAVLWPIATMIFYLLRARSMVAHRRLILQQGEVRESLTFEERIAALEKIPLFASLNDQERLNLLTEMQPAYFKDGDYIVHQGELGREFFVIVKGQAIAFFTDYTGNAISLADLMAGDAFGEIALIDDVPRTASVISDGGCIVLVLRKDGFERFCATLGSPDRVKAMIRLTSFFRRHPLFSKLTAFDQAMLIDSFKFETVTAGEQISGGDDSFHVIYAGKVRVDTGGAEGETDLETDDCFGYANPLNVRYVALEGTGLLTVAKDEFHNLIWEKLVQKPELFL